MAIEPFDGRADTHRPPAPPGLLAEWERTGGFFYGAGMSELGVEPWLGAFKERQDNTAQIVIAGALIFTGVLVSVYEWLRDFWDDNEEPNPDRMEWEWDESIWGSPILGAGSPDEEDEGPLRVDPVESFGLREDVLQQNTFSGPSSVSAPIEPNRVAQNAVSHLENNRVAPGLRQAIDDASLRTGVDRNLLWAVAWQETRFGNFMNNTTSSAQGVFQIMPQTMNTLQERYSHLDLAAGPNNIGASARAAAALLSELRRGFTASFRSDPSPTDLYVMYLMGAGQGLRFLRALLSDPNRSAASLFPQQAAANRSVFYDGGRARTLREVYAYLERVVGGSYHAIRDFRGGKKVVPKTTKNTQNLAPLNGAYAQHTVDDFSVENSMFLPLKTNGIGATPAGTTITADFEKTLRMESAIEEDDVPAPKRAGSPPPENEEVQNTFTRSGSQSTWVRAPNGLLVELEN